jgi:hypothetical protein
LRKKEIITQPEHFGDAVVPAFGYELIRNFLIPELLGNETASILYWAGRKIARLYPAESEEQLPLFFQQAGWGTLECVAKGPKQIVFDLHSPLVASRIEDHPRTVLFTMEAGFLAQQIQHMYGYMAETYSDIRTGRDKKVKFAVKWDSKDPVSEGDNW